MIDRKIIINVKYSRKHVKMHRKFSKINDTFSKTQSIVNGDPQGSVSSVILFLILINSILLVVTNLVKVYLFTRLSNNLVNTKELKSN